MLIRVRTSYLKAALAAVKPAISTDETRLSLFDRILLERANGGKQISLTATNGHRIHTVNIAVVEPLADALERAVFRPLDLEIAVKLAGKEETCAIDTAKAQSETENPFPEWTRVVPAKCAADETGARVHNFNPNYFAEAMVSAAKCLKAVGRANMVRIQFGADNQSPMRIDADGCGEVDFLAVVMPMRL